MCIEQDMNLVRKIAWNFAKDTDIDFEELFAEAAVAYLEADMAYDPAKNDSFAAWAWTCMRNRLIDVARRHDETCEARESLTADLPDPDRALIFHQLMGRMSGDALTICLQVLDDPVPYISHPPKSARGRIKRELREAGWSWARIWRSFGEVRQLLALTETA